MPAIPARLLDLEPADRLQMEAWLAEFEEGWDEHRLAARVERLPPPGRPLRLPALIELIKIDLERNWQSGRHVALADYLARYPELGSAEALPADLRQAEDDVRRQYGEMPATVLAAPAGASTAPPTPAGPAPSAASRAPSVRGYELLSELGRGGMGVVYRARQASLGREVAVKVLPERFARDSRIARRFFDEAHITAQLQHPGIPSVHDLGTLPDGRPFLAMKLIKGQTLEALLAARADPASERGRFVAAFEAICQALAYAHAHNVIHRDLKPANVMVGAFGEIQVMDWGLAKVLSARPTDGGDPGETTPGTEVRSLRDSEDLLTQAGSVMGTPAYMAPEQALGAVHEVDRRSDVFGLGGILAAILTGRPPFVGDTAESTRVMAAKGRVQDCFARLDASGADPELVALCKRCLAPERDERPADAGDVAREVAGLRAAADERARRLELDRVRMEAEQTAAAAKAAEQRRRRRVQWTMAAAVGLVLAVGVAVASWLAVRAEKAEAKARHEATVADQARTRTRAALDEVSSEAIETLLTQQRELTDRHKVFLRRTLELYAELAAESGDAPETRAGVARAFQRMMVIRERLGELAEARAAGERAVEGLAALTDEFPDVPAYRADLAAADSSLAYVLLLQGDRAGAKRRLRDAVGLLEPLHEADPAEVKCAANLANALIKLSNCLADRMERTDAEAGYRRAIGLIEPLPTWPTDAKCGEQLGSARYNLALLLSEMDRPADAEAEYGRSIAVYERLVQNFPHDPDLARRLSSTLINTAGLLAKRKAWDEAETLYRRGLTIQEQLVKDYPAVPEYQKYLGRTLVRLASLCAGRGKADEARGLYRQSVEVRQRLADRYQHAPEYRRDLGSIHNDFAYFEEELGRPDEAEAGYRRALAVQEPLIKDYPEVPEYRLEISNSYSNLGDILRKRKDYPAAERAHRQALEQDQWLHKRFPELPEYLMRAGAEEGNVALVIADRGDKAGAVKWFTASLDHLKAALRQMERPSAQGIEWLLNTSVAFAGTLEGLAAADETSRALKASARFEQGRALALLAKLGADPHSGVTADQASGFADRAVTALADAVKAGWADPAELKGPDFDRLRQREDFQTLLKELEAKAVAPGRPTEHTPTGPPKE